MSAATDLIDALRRQGVEPRTLCADSRAVRPGDVFVAIPGTRSDGRDHVQDAVARGAIAVIHEAGEIPAVSVPHVEAAGLAALSGEIAHLVYGRPSERLWMAGVTGTNGKTSVSQWIAQAMTRLECKCGVIGTLGSGFPGALVPGPNTTPEAVALHRTIARFIEEGAAACAMEVSSIGLDQGRVNGIAFDAAIFTNLTRDHLEYHGTLEAYGAAKARLFAAPGLSVAVLNLDDPFGRDLAAKLRGRVATIGYTLEARTGADRLLSARELAMTPEGIEFMLDGVRICAPLVGRFNASNLLAVTGALLAADETLEDIAVVLRRIEPPAGRMQSFGGEPGMPLVVVDYAHSPDALEKALAALRETATARGGHLACVFGCGGDRDTGKRPMMGAVAEALADRVVLTADNPRGEDVGDIIAAIRDGMKAAPAVEPDRATAIRTAVFEAEPRDVILVAGKGHEPYQEVAGVRHPFSDAEEVRRALEARR